MRGLEDRVHTGESGHLGLRPVPHGQPGEGGGSQSGRLAYPGPDDRYPGEIGLQLQEEVVARGATIGP